ncbi:MAG: HNH endonuclease [Gammaproteobacteria bacterium]|nr:HNH endonuclease [Gammaproteobacteria bacterium]
MWRWDQGRLSYFQFDNLRAMARLALAHDWKAVEKSVAVAETGLRFLPDKPGYERPWRNYSRTLKRGLIVYDDGSKAVPTPVAELLAGDGLVTADEYFHFVARTFTDPSPALQGWDPETRRRYPLVFTLRYGLTKPAEKGVAEVALDEVLRAYSQSELLGDEEYSRYAAVVSSGQDTEVTSPAFDPRQARESLKAISQISYLHYDGQALAFSLDTRDAKHVFDQLHPINGIPEENPDMELLRLATPFNTSDVPHICDLKNTVASEAQNSGFEEGNKAKRTHITIERNSKLRDAYFAAYPSAICDACEMDTSKRYPWALIILDLHHLLPLSSGTRVEQSGTVFSDLAPLCPTCHRAVHRYYDAWPRDECRSDFESMGQAREVYGIAKTQIAEAVHAQ